ncbi:hypothetical protein ACTPD5_22295, partial [Clostridioides difficile]
MGLFFMGAIVLLEKSQKVLNAMVVSPVKVSATTIDEYRKHVEKDSALERRFQPVMVDEPTKEDSIKILEGLR